MSILPSTEDFHRYFGLIIAIIYLLFKQKIMKKILFSFLLTGFLLTGLNTFSQSNIFIFFEPPADPAATVPGESISKDHLNETELQSVSSGFSNAVTFLQRAALQWVKQFFQRSVFQSRLEKVLQLY